jgi:hypothetical protein
MTIPEKLKFANLDKTFRESTQYLRDIIIQGGFHIKPRTPQVQKAMADLFTLAKEHAHKVQFAIDEIAEPPYSYVGNLIKEIKLLNDQLNPYTPFD